MSAAAAFAQDAPRVAVGVVGGAFLKDLFDSQSRSYYIPGSGQIYTTPSYGDAREKRYLVGPSVEVRLPYRLSVEFDALYSRLNGELYNPATVGQGLTPVTSYALTANRWEFPLLAKYNIPALSHLHPFVGAGPSFSLLSQEQYKAAGSTASGAAVVGVSRNDFSGNARNLGTGIAVAGGLSFDFLHVRMTPQVRYTHRERSSFILPTSPDGVQAVVGFTFGK